jgi:decaprenyl-phosphate phosphoribosyltransferase
VESAAIFERSRLRAVISAARPRQWVKNGLVVIAPAAGGVLFRGHVLVHMVVVFASFCAAASGVYMLNDVKDVAADRAHPTKQHRAIASGQLSARTARILGIIYLLAALGISQIGSFNAGVLIVIAVYIANSLAYIYGLKNVAVIEMACVAAGFVLRALSGATAIHLFVSQWFLVVVSFGALFLVVGKRTAELHRLGENAAAHRKVLSEYSENFLFAALTMTATITITGYCLWAFDTSSSGLSSTLHNIVPIRLSVVPIVLATLHVLRLLIGGGGGAPEELALEDRTLQALAVVWVALMMIGIYA